MQKRHILLAILLGLALIGVYWWTTPRYMHNGLPVGPPQFSGYNSNTIRIEPRNLTQLKQAALRSGYNVSQGIFPDDMEVAKGVHPGTFLINSYSNTTWIQFTYDERSNATSWLWIVLQDSMRLNDTRLAQVKTDFLKGPHWVDSSGNHISAMVHGTPDWSILASFLGKEISRDTENVGYIVVNYDSGASMKLFSDSIYIENNVAGSKITCIIRVDSDSDISLWVETPSRLEDPMHLFKPMFDSLGIPESELSRLSLNEILVYPG